MFAAQYGEVEKDPDNLVYVCVTIPGLKKKFLGHKATNAVLELDLQERYSSVSHCSCSKEGCICQASQPEMYQILDQNRQ